MKAFTKNVVIFQGDTDTTVPSALSEDALIKFPSAQLVVIDGAGHTFTIKDKCIIVAGSIKFLAKNK